jgi:hypothetical protein
VNHRFGAGFSEQGLRLSPTLPPGWGPVTLTGLPYRDATVDITLKGAGTRIRTCALDDSGRNANQQLALIRRARPRAVHHAHRPGVARGEHDGPALGQHRAAGGRGDGHACGALRYPMSVDWSGSSNLAIGSGKAAIDEARHRGEVAILDPRTRTLTALRRGSVTVSVTNDSMRAYSGDSSLAPITTSKTIQVVPSTDGTT